MKFWKYIYELKRQENNQNESPQNQNSAEEQLEDSQSCEELNNEAKQSSQNSEPKDDTSRSQREEDIEQDSSINQSDSREESSSSDSEKEEQGSSTKETSDEQISEDMSSKPVVRSDDNDMQRDSKEKVQRNVEQTTINKIEESKANSRKLSENEGDSTENTGNEDEKTTSESLHTEEAPDSNEKQDDLTPKEDEKGETPEDTLQTSQPNQSEVEPKKDDIKEFDGQESKEEDLEKRKQKLKELRDKIQELRDRKEQESQTTPKEKHHLNGEQKEVEQSEEKPYELSDQTNEFLNQLNELPSFKDRERGPGYSIDTEGYTELPDSIIRTLITKFLNQRFCKRNTDLNVRSNSLEKSKGFYRWEVKDVIIHLETEQVTKVLDDKYGYEYANGRNENVPLSFYFDMSGSMSRYTNLLAVIAIELLKKNVKVLIGFNERVNVQIESISKNIDVSELASILESAGYTSYGWGYGRNNFIKDPRVTFKYVNQNLDNYLISKKAEKCVVFSDFDPIREVINLSRKVNVYWFCFETDFERRYIEEFNGFIYQVQNAKDIAEGLIKVNQRRFESLVYLDNPKKLQRKLGGK